MARLTGPLFSLAASGTLAKAVTYASWKGIQYARVRVIPANPQTDDQTDVRNVFTTLSELWKRMPALGRAPYTAAVAGQPLTARNKHVQRNVKLLRDAAAMNPYIWSISGGQALPPATYVPLAAGGGRLNCAITGPTPPVGYTLYSAVIACMLRGDPTDSLTLTMYASEDTSGALNPNIQNLDPDEYESAAWLVWTRNSDSKTFYSSFLEAWVVIT